MPGKEREIVHLLNLIGVVALDEIGRGGTMGSAVTRLERMRDELDGAILKAREIEATLLRVAEDHPAGPVQ